MLEMTTAQPPGSTPSTRVGNIPVPPDPRSKIPILKEFIQEYHGPIRSVETCTDITDRGTNIINIDYSDNTHYKVAINSADEAVRAYRYIRGYVFRHDCVSRLRSFRVVFSGCVRLKGDIDRVVDNSENVFRFFRPRIVENPTRDLNILAVQLGLSPESAKKALEREAARNQTLLVRAKSSRVPHALTAVRQRAAFELLLSQSRFADTALPDHERLLEAKNLVQTYDKLRKHDVNFDGSIDTVKEARSFLNKAIYQRRKGQSSRLIQP